MWNDIAVDRLPSFAWIAPDDCRDVHWMNGPCETVTGQTKTQRIAIGDAYIKQVVNAIAGQGHLGHRLLQPDRLHRQQGHLPGRHDPGLGPPERVTPAPIH